MIKTIQDLQFKIYSIQMSRDEIDILSLEEKQILTRALERKLKKNKNRDIKPQKEKKENENI